MRAVRGVVDMLPEDDPLRSAQLNIAAELQRKLDAARLAKQEQKSPVQRREELQDQLETTKKKLEANQKHLEDAKLLAEKYLGFVQSQTERVAKLEAELRTIKLQETVAATQVLSLAPDLDVQEQAIMAKLAEIQSQLDTYRKSKSEHVQSSSNSVSAVMPTRCEQLGAQLLDISDKFAGRALFGATIPSRKKHVPWADEEPMRAEPRSGRARSASPGRAVTTAEYRGLFGA